MKRQTFLRTATGSALGLTAAATGWFTLRGNIRVRPLYAETCGNSFLKFCERARFATAEEAVQTVARRRHAFELFVDGADAAAPVLPEAQPPAQRITVPVAATQDSRALKTLKTAMIRSRRDPATVVTSMNFCTDAVG